MAFLGSRLQGFRWLGMGFVTVGLVIVGVTDLIFGNSSKDDVNGIITGSFFLFFADLCCFYFFLRQRHFLCFALFFQF